MPTLMVDEGDFKDSDETAELVKFFNLGFEQNRKMFNCDKNDPSRLEFFDPYCPKLITRRRQFKDTALEARCITEVMRQTNRKDIPPLLTKKFYETQAKLRNKLLKFRFDFYDKIDIDKAAQIDLGDVEPRIKQATLAFTTLLANVPEALESFKKFIQNYNKTIIEDRATSYDGQIINAIVDLLISGNQYINSKEINAILVADGLKSTERMIGHHLRQLGLKTIPKNVEGKTKRVLTIDSTFFDVVKRYCIDQDKITKITLITVITKTPTPTPEQAVNNIEKENRGVCNNVINVIDVIENGDKKEEKITELTPDKKDVSACGYCGRLSYLEFKDSEGHYLCRQCSEQEAKQ